MPKIWIALGSLFCFMSVAAGAFGAHGLKGKLSPDMLATFETAARYQMYHGLALFVVGWLSVEFYRPSSTIAGWLFTVGVATFSGSLYLLALTGVRWLGAITPIGGLCLLLGWLALLTSAFKS